MVFQSYALFPHMTVLENVCYGPLSMRIRQGEGARARAREARDARPRRARATACRRSSPAASSSASRSRARSCSSPRCCCSTSRCRTSTPSCAAACAQEIRELQQSLALTVIYVTHDQEEALAVSDHIIVMDGGRIAQQGTPHELYEAPASRFLADFIGDANLVDGELDGGRGRRDVHRRRRRRAGARRRHRRRARRRSRCGRTGCALVDAGAGQRCRACASAPPISAAGSSTWSTTPWGELLVFDAEARDAAPARRAGRRRLRPRRRDRAAALITETPRRPARRAAPRGRPPRRSRSGSPASSPGSPRRPTRSR